METKQFEKPVQFQNPTEGKQATIWDEAMLELFRKKEGWEELETTHTLQFWDEEHGWMFTFPLMRTNSEEETNSVLIKLAEIFPKHRFRNYESLTVKVD